ncbi:MAG: 3-oxoadipate enol-lactonase [Candidatus Acidiferrum sp.]
MSFAQLKDVRIHYELVGAASAPALVFSNSLGENLSMWDPQLAALQKDFCVLRYDTRGHGQSSVTPGPYTIELLARDVLGLLDALNLRRVYFCGLSMGGQTGMWLGLNAPDRLQKLVLCNTSAKIGTPEFWNPRIETVRKSGMKAISAAVVGRWFSPAYLAKFPAVAETAQRVVENTDPNGYAANCEALREFDAQDTVAGIRVPTLVIAGTNDAATTPAEGQYLASRIPGARYVELNAAHLSNLEESNRFNSELMAFLHT